MDPRRSPAGAVFPKSLSRECVPIHYAGLAQWQIGSGISAAMQAKFAAPSMVEQLRAEQSAAGVDSVSAVVRVAVGEHLRRLDKRRGRDTGSLKQDPSLSL